MRLQIQVRGERLALSVKEGSTVGQLAAEAVKKFKKLKPVSKEEEVPTDEAVIKEIRKIVGGSLMDPEDRVEDLLKDGDFVKIVLNTDPVAPLAPTSASTTYSTGPPWSIDGMDSSLHFIRRGSQTLILDGCSLKPEDLFKCGQGIYKIKLSRDSERRVQQARALLENVIKESPVVYGITTGFGNFAHVVIPHEQLLVLQENLIKSHACGVGAPLSPSRGLMVLALRINVLAKGYSGISIGVLQKLIDAFNAGCVSWIPEKGTVGCSGDLAPLAHLALGLMGIGRMWSPETGWDEAEKVLRIHKLEPIKLRPKEGIALINGTQLVTALASEAIVRAEAICRQADVIAAMTLDVLKGTTTAYDAAIHELRPHPGQKEVAKVLRTLLHSENNPSEIAESHRFCDKVQDSYTLRCVPQVHGIVRDTIEFVRKIINVELNCATDNPLVFCDRGEILSGGNFHGEYPAKALDYLAIAVHELAQMSERRLERLLNSTLSGLPAFLTKDGGVNSGLMMVQVTAASLVSENKVLCHPSSVDSIPTSANQEDHVAMGGFAARKALRIIEHVEQVLAMELLAACQGMEFLKPLQSTAPLQEVYNVVRQVSPPIECDRFLAPEIEAIVLLLQQEKVWGCVLPHIQTVFGQSAIESRAPSPTASAITQELEIKVGGLLSPIPMFISKSPSRSADFDAALDKSSPISPLPPV